MLYISRIRYIGKTCSSSCNALKAMAECLDKLGKENLATLCYYELKHIKLEVLETREVAKEVVGL